MSAPRLKGIIAAAYTPMHKDQRLHLDQVGAVVDHLINAGIEGLYVCGSTGEGMSLTSEERRRVAEAYVKSARRRVPVIIQVGHNSLAEAAQLAAHAQQIGADIVSATCPSYFRIPNVDTLVDCMTEVAGAAPQLPFYYYHIPSLTNVTFDMVEFLNVGATHIPNLRGLKFTDTTIHDFQRCLELDKGHFDVVWGCDEMLLSAMAIGAKAAIGSTYNIAAPLYRQIIKAFESGDLHQARELQSRSVTLINTIKSFPFHPAMKHIMAMLGVDCGPCRLPQPHLSSEEVDRLNAELQDIGFFRWANPVT